MAIKKIRIGGQDFELQDTTYGNATTLAAGLMSSSDKTKLDSLTSYSLPTASSNEKGGIKIGYSQNNKNYPVELDTNGKAFVNVPWVTNTTYSLGGLMGSSTIGGTTQPIYWNGSAFVNTSYTLGKSVPSDAKFTDTIYTLPLADVLTKGGLRAGYADNYQDDYVKYGISVVTESNLSNYECAYVGISTVSHHYAGLMSTADKVKLDNIETSANNYSLPTASTSTLGGIKVSNTLSTAVTLTSSDGFTSDRYYGVQRDRNGKAFVNVPWENTHPTFTAVTGKPTTNQTPSFGGTFTISQISQDANGQITVTDRTVKIPSAAATTSNAGLMSASDKTKLDNLASKVSSLESQISSLNSRINEILSGGYY